MTPWERLDDGTDVVDIEYRPIVQKRFRMSNGHEIQANISSRENSQGALVIALTPEKRVIVARQFRCGPEKIMDDMPGGLVEPGESPEKAAKRELLEETGYTSDRFTYLGQAYVNPWDNMTIHYFMALDCFVVPGVVNPDDREEIEIDTIPISQFFENAKRAQMSDIQGVVLAYDKLKALEAAS